MEKVTVLLADDHKMVVNAVAHLVNSCDAFVVAGEAYSRQMVMELTVKTRPQIFVLEVHLAMAHQLELQKYIRKYLPAARIIWVVPFPIVAYTKGW